MLSFGENNSGGSHDEYSIRYLCRSFGIIQTPEEPLLQTGKNI